jgi:hypothetical protein
MLPSSQVVPVPTGLRAGLGPKLTVLVSARWEPSASEHRAWTQELLFASRLARLWRPPFTDRWGVLVATEILLRLDPPWQEIEVYPADEDAVIRSRQPVSWPGCARAPEGLADWAASHDRIVDILRRGPLRVFTDDPLSERDGTTYRIAIRASNARGAGFWARGEIFRASADGRIWSLLANGAGSTLAVNATTDGGALVGPSFWLERSCVLELVTTGGLWQAVEAELRRHGER